MAKILIIKANPVGEFSYTNKLLKHFMTEYQSIHPEDSITIKELGDIEFVSSDKDMLRYRASGIAEEDKEQTYKQFDLLCDEFLEYDKYVFAYPNWNLLVPPSLVNYVLWVFRKKKIKREDGTSKLENKKCMALYTSGGYTNTVTNTSFGLEWFKVLMVKYGMGKSYFVNAEGLEGDEETVRENYEKYKKQVKDIAKEF